MIDKKFKREALSLKQNIKKRNQQKLIRSKYNHYNASSSSLVIHGGAPLCGKVNISGAKNAALPLLYASILSNDNIVLNNIPDLSDIQITISILKELGASIKTYNKTVEINTSSINKFTACKNLVSSMRASALMIGPLLAKYNKVSIASPGGCTIGKRPIDIHLECLTHMGVTIEENSTNCIKLTAKNGLHANTINIKRASVGATENLIMAATLAKGTTKLLNVAKEPEVIDLIKMLKMMGAKISGEGTSTLIIEGVQKLNGVAYTVCPDRIEAGSYLMAAAITKGNLTLNNIDYDSLKNIITPLQEIGCIITLVSSNSINIKTPKILYSKDIITLPYPGFPTDLQPQWTTLMCVTKGESCIEETIFENRLGHTKELIKMGADIKILDKNHKFSIKGIKELQGTAVFPTDLRSSFALIMAGLVAKGITTIYNLTYLDRGYEDAYNKLKNCGANILRINNSLEDSSLEDNYINTNKINLVQTT